MFGHEPNKYSTDVIKILVESERERGKGEISTQQKPVPYKSRLNWMDWPTLSRDGIVRLVLSFEPSHAS